MLLLIPSSEKKSSQRVFDRLPLSIRSRRNIVRLVLALLVFLVVYKMVDIFALSSIAKIVVDMESDQDTVAVMYYSSSLNQAVFEEKKTSKQIEVKANSRKRHGFDLENKAIRKVRLDPGNTPGVYRLYSLTAQSFFGDIKPIQPYLPEVDIVPGPGTSIVKKNGYLEIVAATEDPSIIINHKLKVDNPFLLLATPLFATLLVLTVLEEFSLSSCVFWTDTIKKSPSAGTNFDALDGLRGLAALFVLATHTGVPGCDSVGHVGVVIFFCLSGFLLTLPYAKNSALIVSASNVRKYYLRRLRRIVPMFYFILIISYLFHERIDVFIRSILFIQGNSILWTVLQETHFYIFLPVLLLINHFVLRGNRGLILSLLLVLSYCFNHGIVSSYRIFGLGQSMNLLAGLFLCGIMMSYLCQIEGVKNWPVLRRLCIHPVVGLVLLVGIIGIEQIWALSHNGVVKNSSWLLSGNFNYLVGALIGLVVLFPESLPAKLLSSLPLRLFGTVSYSFYLLHPICLKIVKTFANDYLGHSLSGVGSFMSTLVLTFILSTITYAYIEKPFLMKSIRLQKEALGSSG